MNENINLEGNTEIEKALEEFEVKSQAEQMQKNPEIFKNNSETPKMIQLVMKYSGGGIKNEKQAQYFLLGFVAVAITITIILLLNAFREPSEAPAGFKGNIPNTPEYQNPPWPDNLQ